MSFHKEPACKKQGEYHGQEAGCVYGLLHGMNDEELVRFAGACSAVAISRFPLPLKPPRLEEVKKMTDG